MYTLVLVEDDYQIRSGLSRFFPWRQIGFDFIRGFENGKQALEFLTVNEVDVVLTDIRMPVMDGLTLAAELKRQRPQTIVVFLSAYREFDYAHRALEIGVQHYIVKSTKYDDLVKIFTDLKRTLDARGEESTATPPPAPELAAGDRVVQKVLDGIAADVAGATLSSAAQRVNMNPVYLSRYFKEKTGTNFGDYVIRVKMEKAAQLLRDTRYPIAKISEIVGYSNEKNFSRAFKKFHKITPQSFRHTL